MFQSIGGLINDIITFGIFVYLILLLTGKVRLRRVIVLLLRVR